MSFLECGRFGFNQCLVFADFSGAAVLDSSGPVPGPGEMHASSAAMIFEPVAVASEACGDAILDTPAEKKE